MAEQSKRFLHELTARLESMGHRPKSWIKGRWGFHVVCAVCGATAACCVSDTRIREFPEDTCVVRQRKVREAFPSSLPGAPPHAG